jgi:hypothetical protein
VLGPDGRLRSVTSACVAGLAPPAAARLGEARARRVAAGALGLPLAAERSAARLWVRRSARGDRLEWEVRVPLADGRESSTWIDAEDGAIRALDESTVHAVGLAFPSDPRAPEAEVPLVGIVPGQGLASRAFAIEDQQVPRAVPLGPGDDYRYASTTLEFDQVNAYWHCDRFLRDFLAPLGHPGPPDSLIVRVHVPLEPAVALTNGRYVLLGRPIHGQVGEVSRCHDIVYHELGHAVLFGEGVLAGGEDAGALHEALADYLSAAFTGDPAIGEWLYLNFPLGATRVDQPVDPWHARNRDRVAWGAAPIASVWANGMILSSALWDLRARLGSSADSLVLESLDYLPTTPRWSHLANALLQADLELHGGRHAAAIVESLARRGVRGAAVAAFTGPASLAPGEVGEFRAQPCCGGIAGEARWRTRAWCRGGPCEDWRDVGGGPLLRTAFQQDGELSLIVASAWADTLEARRLVSVNPPEIRLQGPARVALGRHETWCARVAAMGPWRFVWERLWRRPGAPPQRLGGTTEVAFAVEAPFLLRVELTDGMGRIARDSLEVEAFADTPPTEERRTLVVSHRLLPGASDAETRIDVGRAGPLRAEVFDVRGRRRARIWDGTVERGRHVFRWDARGLEPGAYLLRVRFEAEGSLLRFVLLR